MKAILIEEFKKRPQVKEVSEPNHPKRCPCRFSIWCSRVLPSQAQSSAHARTCKTRERWPRAGSSNAITPARRWKKSMTSLMKCVPARSTVASFWKWREQTPGIIWTARQR